MVKLAMPQMPRVIAAPMSVVVVNGSANETTISTASPALSDASSVLADLCLDQT